MNISVNLVDYHSLIHMSITHLMAEVNGIDKIRQTTSTEDEQLLLRA